MSPQHGEESGFERARLSPITIVGRGGPPLEKETFILKEHVIHVKSTACDKLPAWDEIPGEWR
jgi:hypothetical protein